MSMRRLVTWIAFLAVFAMAARFSVDSDTWWHLRAGKWMVQNRQILKTDYFSYTRYGEAWEYPGWLAEVGLASIYRLSGPGGLNLWTALMVTLSFWFVWKTLTGGVFLRTFVIILAAAAAGIYWAARPYMVTFLFAAITLWILEGWRWSKPEERKAAKRLWLLPALMAVWANCHGGFIAGFILIGIYFLAEALGWIGVTMGRRNLAEPEQDRPPAEPRNLAEPGKDRPAAEPRNLAEPEQERPQAESRNLAAAGQDRPAAESPNAKHAVNDHAAKLKLLAGIGLLMGVGAMINPHGAKILLYPFKTISIGALGQYIQEWQPPDFHSAQVQPFVWLLLLSFAAVGFSRRRLALSDCLLFTVFAYLSFSAARNIALFALAAAPVLARHAAPLAEALSRRAGFTAGAAAEPRRFRTINLLIFIVLALAVAIKAATVLPLAANQEEIGKTMPVEAVGWLQENQPPGRLFNAYNWGGYLLWELPEYPVFIDGRTDLYDDALVSEWLGVVRAEEGWEEALDRWGVRLVLIEHGLPLESQLENEGWMRLDFGDEASGWMR